MRKRGDKGALVEIFGLPASGKTSLGNRVKDILTGRGIHVNYASYILADSKRHFSKKLRMYASLTLFVLANFAYVLRSARVILSREERDRTYTPRHFKGWLFTSYLIHCYRKSVKPEVTLFDQALFQVLWSLGFSSKQGYLSNLPDDFLKSIYTTDLVVVLEVDIGTIEQRLNARDSNISCLEQLGPPSPLALNKSVNVFEDVKTILMDIKQQRSDLQVVFVDNNRDSDLETNALNIADAIEQVRKRKCRRIDQS
jgi:thymidylate kinase